MAAPTLAASGLVQLVAGLAFAIVARALARRPVAAPDRLPARAFVAWWGCLSAYMLLVGGIAVAASFGYSSFESLLATRVLAIPLLMASVWGLTFHVAYLFTGRHDLNWPIAAFYAACGVAFLLLTFVLEPPTGIKVSPWLVELTREGGTPYLNLLYVSIGLPPIVASLLYGTLAWRVPTGIQRYRVALVAGSILAWVGSGLAARISMGDLEKFVTLAVFGLGAAAAVVLAYFPPPGVRARLDPDDADAWSHRERAREKAAERQAKLEERCRTLV